MLPRASGCHPAAARPARLHSTLGAWAGHGQASGAALSSLPCCQHSMGLAAKQGSARAPPGTSIGVLPPGLQPMPPSYPGRPGTLQALGCSVGAHPALGSAHIPPQGKRRAGAGGRLSERGLSCVVPGLWLPPAPTLSLGTLSTPHGGRDQCVPGCPQPWLPWGTQPRGPAHRCPCSCSHKRGVPAPSA